MKSLANDRNGFGALLANPFVLLVLIIVIIVAAIMGGLFVLYAPNIAAAGLLVFIAVLMLWKIPMPDMRVKVGLFVAMLVAAILIYFYGSEILGVFA